MADLQIELLHSIADPVRFDLVQRLIAGPATQKELAHEFELNSGTLSKKLATLEHAGIVARKRPHAPYEIQFRNEIAKLLQLVLNLQAELDKTREEKTAARSKRLNKSIVRPMTPARKETG